jgi:hypothetical protein
MHFFPQLDLPFDQLTTLHFHHSLDVFYTAAILPRCQNLLDLYSFDSGLRGHLFRFWKDSK